VPELTSALQAMVQRSERQGKLLERITKIFPDGKATQTAINILHQRLPKFVYFDHYYRLPGQVALDALAQRRAQNVLTPEDRVFFAPRS